LSNSLSSQYTLIKFINILDLSSYPYGTEYFLPPGFRGEAVGS